MAVLIIYIEPLRKYQESLLWIIYSKRESLRHLIICLLQSRQLLRLHYAWVCPIRHILLLYIRKTGYTPTQFRQLNKQKVTLASDFILEGPNHGE